jgi:hypothetical protein
VGFQRAIVATICITVATMGVDMLQINRRFAPFLSAKLVPMMATMGVIVATMELLYLSTFCSLFG